MNIKRLLPALLAAAFVVSPVVEASENETVFLNAQGKLVIPHLRLGNEIYYVILERTSPTAYNFNLNAASVTKVTPQPGDDWASKAEVIGDWAIQGEPGVTLGIFGSGSYSVVTPADDDGCPAGTETGTWTLDESTGVFFNVAVSDANADCGLSHPEGVMRMKRVGANLQIHFVEVENGVPTNGSITLVPL